MSGSSSPLIKVHSPSITNTNSRKRPLRDEMYSCYRQDHIRKPLIGFAAGSLLGCVLQSIVPNWNFGITFSLAMAGGLIPIYYPSVVSCYKTNFAKSNAADYYSKLDDQGILYANTNIQRVNTNTLQEA